MSNGVVWEVVSGGIAVECSYLTDVGKRKRYIRLPEDLHPDKASLILAKGTVWW